MSTLTRTAGITLLAAALCASTGCTGLFSPEDLAALIGRAEQAVNNVIDNLQERNPFAAPGGFAVDQAGVDVGAGQDVLVIDDFSEDVNSDALYSSTFIGFTNVTGFDIAIDYVVTIGNLILQDAAWAYNGETVLLGYDCADIVAVTAEYDFDPFTGEFVQTFPFADLFALRYVNFDCGYLIEFTFTPTSVDTNFQFVDLIP